MKKAWKWVLGILIIVVVVGVLVAVPLVMRHVMAARIGVNVQAPQAQQGQNNGPQTRGDNGSQSNAPGGFENRGGPMMGGRPGFNNRGGPMMGDRPGFDNRGGPMMGGRSGFNRGFMPFGFGFMFIGGLLRMLVPLVLLGLLLYGVYRLGKRDGLRAVPVTAVPVSAPAAPSVADIAADNQTPLA